MIKSIIRPLNNLPDRVTDDLIQSTVNSIIKSEAKRRRAAQNHTRMLCQYINIQHQPVIISQLTAQRIISRVQKGY